MYIIKSEKDFKLYIGLTNDLRRRMWEHNNGLSAATKHRRPFKLVYYEAYTSREDAADRERKLKRYKNSYSHLKNRIRQSLKA